MRAFEFFSRERRMRREVESLRRRAAHNRERARLFALTFVSEAERLEALAASLESSIQERHSSAEHEA